MAKAKQMSLYAVRNMKEVCRLPRDHFDLGDWSIMTDGYIVWISKQKIGHEQTDHIEIPKRIFDQLVDRYAKPMPIGTWRGDKFLRATKQ